MDGAPPPGFPNLNPNMPLSSQVQNLTAQQLAEMQGNVKDMYRSATRAMEERDRIARAIDTGRQHPTTGQPF